MQRIYNPVSVFLIALIISIAALFIPAHAAPEKSQSPVQLLLVTSDLSLSSSAETLAEVDHLFEPDKTAMSLVAVSNLNKPGRYETGYKTLLSGAFPNQPEKHDVDVLGAELPGSKTYSELTPALDELPQRLSQNPQALNIVQLSPASSPEFRNELAAFKKFYAAHPVRTVLVSVGEIPPRESSANTPAALQVLATNTGAANQLFYSANTRSLGVLTIPDVTYLVAAGRSDLPAALANKPDPELREYPGSQQLLEERHLTSQKIHQATPWALGIWLVPTLGLGVASFVMRRRGNPRLAQRLGFGFFAAPLILPASFFANAFTLTGTPWWRWQHPGLGLSLQLIPIALLFTVIVWTVGTAAQQWRKDLSRGLSWAAVAGLLVAGIPLLDSALGSPWQLSTPLGADPLWGGRFYGISNHLFSLVIAGIIWPIWWLCCVFEKRWQKALICGGFFIVVASICVNPAMGADVGSLIANTVLFGLLFAYFVNIKLSLKRITLALVAAALALTGVGVLDYLRPEENRSHAGRFIASVLDGSALEIVTRKAHQNLFMVIDFPALAPVMVLVITLLVLVLWPRFPWQIPGLHDNLTLLSILRCLAWASLVGFALNDTGTVLLAVSCGVALVMTAGYLGTTGNSRRTGSAR